MWGPAPISGTAEATVCAALLVKYKQEVHGDLDFRGTGVNPGVAGSQITMTSITIEMISRGEGASLLSRSMRGVECGRCKEPYIEGGPEV